MDHKNTRAQVAICLGEHPGGTSKRPRRGSTKNTKCPKNPKEITLEDLLRMHKNSRIHLKKLKTINLAIHDRIEPLYMWGCEPLDDVEGCRVKVSLERLHCAPTTWIHRQVTEGCRQYLMDEVITSRARVYVCIMHVEIDKETKDYKPLSEKPEPKQLCWKIIFRLLGVNA